MFQIKDPVTVVGDIHGQYYDLVKMIDVAGAPGANRYLFLGDYVDRGSFSIEVVLLLYAIKMSFPSMTHMLRGNHECRQMTSFFNFRQECLYKYDEDIYERLMESFDSMPISCILNGKFLAVHGGIGPDLKKLDDINKIYRHVEPPKNGLLCDLLWSDPVDTEDGKLPEIYKFNDVRGCSYFFGAEAVVKFLKSNELLSVIRAHEAQLDGYKMYNWKGHTQFPVVITIFSAPNYCDVYNNRGAVIKFQNNTLNIQQFNYTAHPYLLPDFMDLFTWSIPFVAEKIGEILFYILNPKGGKLGGEEQAPTQIVTAEEVNLSERANAIKNKIRSAAKMMVMFKTLRQFFIQREENELITQLKGMTPGHKIPKGLLQQGKDAIQSAVDQFKNAKQWDKINEMRPQQ